MWNHKTVKKCVHDHDDLLSFLRMFLLQLTHRLLRAAKNPIIHEKCPTAPAFIEMPLLSLAKFSVESLLLERSRSSISRLRSF